MTVSEPAPGPPTGGPWASAEVVESDRKTAAVRIRILSFSGSCVGFGQRGLLWPLCDPGRQRLAGDLCKLLKKMVGRLGIEPRTP